MRGMIRFYAPFFLLLALAAAACARWDTPIWLLMREPQNLGHLPRYAGLFSMLTVWLWGASAAACLLACGVLRARRDADRLAAFLLYFGALTVMVMLDDALQLHEQAENMGIPAKLIFGSYFAGLLAGLFSFRREILDTDYRLLASAAGFLGLSVFVDVLQMRYGDALGPWRILFEDGFKLLGAAGWLGYFWTTASRSLRLQGAPG